MSAKGRPEHECRSAQREGTPLSAMLNLQPNLVAPDEFYAELVDAHRELDPAQSALLNAKLILLLANHIGDARVLGEALAAARADIETAGGDAGLASAAGAP